MEPATSCMSSALRVLSIAELLRLIASDISPSDQVRLSQVCHPTFNILVPNIWKELNGAEHLLRLIPSASFLCHKSTGRLQKIVLDEQLGSNQFERFDFYAPFVENLDVYRDQAEHFTLSGWPLLTSRAQICPLLPSLKRLSVACSNHLTRNSDTSMWIRAFGAHTLADFRVADRCCVLNRSEKSLSITNSTAAAIFESLVQHSPNIQHLSMCPRHAAGEQTYQLPKRWYNYLRDLTLLRRLSISDEWISYSSLMAISQLPSLEDLQLHVGTFRGFGTDAHAIDSDFPSSAFSALRGLSLTNVVSPNVSHILNIGKLLRNVTELRIAPSAGSGVFKAQGNWITHKLLPSLANAQSLEFFHIMPYLPEEWTDRNRAEIYLFAIPSEAQDVMSRMPLQAVVWEHLHLGKGRLKLNPAIIWPNVTELVLPYQYASLQELSYFAAMPKLTRLEVSLSLITTFTPKNIPELNHAPLNTLASYAGVDIARDFSIMEHNARILLELWPSLSTVTWDDDEESPPSDSGLVTTFDRLLTTYRAIRVYQNNGEVDLAAVMTSFLDVLRRDFTETVASHGAAQ